MDIKENKFIFVFLLYFTNGSSTLYHNKKHSNILQYFHLNILIITYYNNYNLNILKLNIL